MGLERSRSEPSLLWNPHRVVKVLYVVLHFHLRLLVNPVLYIYLFGIVLVIHKIEI